MSIRPTLQAGETISGPGALLRNIRYRLALHITYYIFSRVGPGNRRMPGWGLEAPVLGAGAGFDPNGVRASAFKWPGRGLNFQDGYRAPAMAKGHEQQDRRPN